MKKLSTALLALLLACSILGCVSVHTQPVQKSSSGSKVQHGNASWYGKPFHGRLTASGERYDMHAPTAAHKSLAFGTRVRVTNLDNGKHTVVRINDRGPFVKGRIIDLSYGAAKQIKMLQAGVVRVKLEILNS
jgi:rare lipoprotein A